ncbi:CheR family methyltransferase [Pseudomonas sp. FEN]|uniref:CheR family methyltransferase n=1 Tax=Pseudomonas sp. FEN TaxID=2767468 RepID=UPI001749FB19|nr:protein-glutamate O-methyltransferase CheR [Pseudomonas sp. FEN]CAD5203935.1 Chemotaxis protein methyltransferase CheR (EC 2.1.1.80) [Pseudomonas sp. FEN]
MSSELTPPPLGDSEFRRLQKLMADASGIVLAPNKRPLMAERLTQRLHHYRLDNYADYLRLLDQPPNLNERRLVVELLISNETYFFREHPHFDYLGSWLAARQAPLKCWSAACSSGEEAYSLAMVAQEHLHNGDWSVLASDLSLSVLEKAGDGIYNMAQAKYFPQGWLHRHCLSGSGDMSGYFRVQAVLRERVSLRQINIVRPLPDDLGLFDVIFLRNVLIYFNNEEKQRIVQRLVSQLRPGGLLFIGHAESIHGLDVPVRLLSPAVYERL